MKSKCGKKRSAQRRAAALAKVDGEGDSHYARKFKYCKRYGVFGFQVPEPKPWKKR